MSKRKLSEKQQRFVEEYLIDLNAKQAAIRAGYAQKRAECQAYQLLHNPIVCEAVTKAKRDLSEKTHIDAAWVLREAASLYKLALEKEELSVAKGSLELCGKHIDVGAFTERMQIGIDSELSDILSRARARSGIENSD